jgi:hypothetical protein
MLQVGASGIEEKEEEEEEEEEAENRLSTPVLFNINFFEISFLIFKKPCQISSKQMTWIFRFQVNATNDIQKFVYGHVTPLL